MGDGASVPAFTKPPPPAEIVAGLNSSPKGVTLRRNTNVPLFDEQAQKQHRLWIAQMATGETQALTALHREFAPLLHGIAKRILNDSEDVREVVQDSFVKAWRRSAAYRPERGEVYGWMVFITRNEAIDRLRRSSRRAAALVRLQNEEQPSAGVEPDEGFEQKELLDRNMAQLSADQRRALELAFFGGCSQAEIATAMRTPVGNVKNHLRRGLLKLRKLVDRHE